MKNLPITRGGLARQGYVPRRALIAGGDRCGGARTCIGTRITPAARREAVSAVRSRAPPPSPTPRARSTSLKLSGGEPTPLHRLGIRGGRRCQGRLVGQRPGGISGPAAIALVALLVRRIGPMVVCASMSFGNRRWPPMGGSPVNERSPSSARGRPYCCDGGFSANLHDLTMRVFSRGAKPCTAYCGAATGKYRSV